MVNLAIAAGIFGALDRQRHAACGAEFIARVLLVSREAVAGLIGLGLAGFILRGSRHEMDLSPKLRQTVKTQFSANGELCHGNATKIHEGV